jgi:CDP-diacylglycerol--glycerol-3-phosphate 3-phosphatidyltransferase
MLHSGADSGRANLSSDYFTNRQDRYHVFSSKDITEYFSRIHDVVSKLSFLVTPNAQLPTGYTLEWPTSNSAPSPLAEPSRFISTSSSILTHLIKAPSTPKASSQPLTSKTNTIIYPLSQLTPLLHPDTSTELPAISSILRTLSGPSFNNSSWTFTAGYFNPDPSLTSLLLSTSSNSNIVITASPYANGFYGSKGVSGLLPAAYTLLSRRFLSSIERAGRQKDIVLKEWRQGTVGEKEGWTYHAKGLWVSLNGDSQPSISVVGSSNYTKRSYGLDLEVGTVIVTSDEGLKRRLREERDGLQKYASRVGMDEFIKTERRVGIRVRIAMWIVGLLGGAL